MLPMKDVQEFIKTAKKAEASAEFKALVDDFEALTCLCVEGKQGEEALKQAEMVEAAQAKFWEALYGVLPSFGLTPDLLDAYIENPDNFSDEQWAKMEMLKQEIAGGY